MKFRVYKNCLFSVSLLCTFSHAGQPLTLVPGQAITILPAEHLSAFPFPQGQDESVELTTKLDSLQPGPSIDLWTRIRSGFALPELNTPLVRKHELWYTARPDALARITARSRRYLFYIVEEIERRGMPMEIALLPIVESAFDPMALSHAQASGLWQFIPSTGKLYGLEQTWWSDYRRDVLAATNGALDYLQKLQRMFNGDWQLALAAYNWGEGSVLRAQAKNRARRKATHYTALAMPKETRHYLPKLQALKNIVLGPERFGVALIDIPNSPYFRTVTVPPALDVKLAAEWADLPIDEFLTLNPAHKRPVIASNAPQTLLVPYDKADLFYAKLEWYDRPLVSWQPYQLSQDEKLATIADKFSISEQELKTANGINQRSILPAGYTILVPLHDTATDRIGNLQPSAFTPLPPEYTAKTHVVKRGETLGGIAKRYGVPIAELKTWNRLRSNTIRAGMKLRLALTAPSSSQSSRRAHR